MIFSLHVAFAIRVPDPHVVVYFSAFIKKYLSCIIFEKLMIRFLSTLFYFCINLFPGLINNYKNVTIFILYPLFKICIGNGENT